MHGKGKVAIFLHRKVVGADIMLTLVEKRIHTAPPLLALLYHKSFRLSTTLLTFSCHFFTDIALLYEKGNSVEKARGFRSCSAYTVEKEVKSTEDP
jgi:hypothetical protein